MRYPVLKTGATIAVTAPSSGVQSELHNMFKRAYARMEEMGFHVMCGDTVWTQNKAKSSPAKVRADEFNKMVQNNNIDIIIPPWGGELLIEILEYVDFKNLPEKWILGYSDTSTLLLAVTLMTGIATAHGPNLVDLRGEYSDDTTAAWNSVLSTKFGESVLQHSSKKFQTEWQHGNPSPCVFHLTEQTVWRTVSGRNEKIQGRLLGGCLDTIRHLVGTPYGDVNRFRELHLNDEPIIWYFENGEMNTTALRRTLVQMKLAGWFERSSGIMFGRSSANLTVDDYTVEDVYNELSGELQIPIIYDIDCGHVPPQITFINGSYAEVEVTEEGKGTVLQRFC